MVVINGVISRVATILTYVNGLITLLRTTHEPDDDSTLAVAEIEGFCREGFESGNVVILMTGQVPIEYALFFAGLPDISL